LPDLVALGPLAERAADAVARHRVARVPIDVIRDAIREADLSLVGAPDARDRLADVIAQLERAGIVALPRGTAGWDRGFLPPLPRYVMRPPEARASRSDGSGAVTWHASLGWAAAGGWTAEEERLLIAANGWLIGGGPRRKVPLQERSLQLLGDEKALGAFLRGPLFAEGRLTLELLGAVRTSPPFVFTKVGRGPYALVVENSATYRTLADAVAGGDTAIGIVAFGGGNGFVRSVEFFAELAESGRLDGPIREIRYFGDLDAEGLRIPVNATRTATEIGLPPVRPAIGLYRRLLDHGRPGPDAVVEPAAAASLVSWLPGELADRALDVLVRGQRLAQEAVGRELLADDHRWATLDELGRGGTARVAIARDPGLPAAELAARQDDAGTLRSPATDADWDTWVSAGRTRNFALGDPLLDWLRRFGPERGFVSDRDLPGYDERTDFATFVQRKGSEFEAGVMRLLAAGEEIVTIALGWEDSRSAEHAEATIAAMRSRAPIIAQGVLRNPDNRTYGMPDLLVRSDVLARLFPESIDQEEAHEGAPALGLDHVHYRVVDIKFHTFDLLADGSAAGDTDSLPYLIQVWIYNEALGRIAGSIPPSAYLLGRNWTCGEERGTGCLERLARVDHERVLARRGTTLADLAAEAVEWVRRMRADGDRWQVLPSPSRSELYPHARNTEDAPWHAAKAAIASELHELTLLPRMNPVRREAALGAGIEGWDDPSASAASLGITEPAGAILCDAVLAANRSPEPVVLPERITIADDAWRSRATVEFFVDFETTSSLDDDFAGLPQIGGQPLIFQIGCGQLIDGAWRFAQWTADRIDPAAEGTIIAAWLAHMDQAVGDAGTTLGDARIVHWSAAEPANLDTAYNSARTRHPEAGWPTALPWFDFLTQVIRPTPLTVTGAFNFGLKAIAKAMHAIGLIETTWSDGATDGLGAMIGAWWCNTEAARRGVPMIEIDLMREIAAYNEVDVRCMAEVVTWLRENR
jgi:hypothetical protein